MQSPRKKFLSGASCRLCLYYLPRSCVFQMWRICAPFSPQAQTLRSSRIWRSWTVRLCLCRRYLRDRWSSLEYVSDSEVSCNWLPELQRSHCCSCLQVPLLEVSGPLAVVQLLETSLLCLVNYARQIQHSVQSHAFISFLDAFRNQLYDNSVLVWNHLATWTGYKWALKCYIVQREVFNVHNNVIHPPPEVKPNIYDLEPRIVWLLAIKIQQKIELY